MPRSITAPIHQGVDHALAVQDPVVIHPPADELPRRILIEVARAAAATPAAARTNRGRLIGVSSAMYTTTPSPPGRPTHRGSKSEHEVWEPSLDAVGGCASDDAGLYNWTETMHCN